MRLLPAHAPDAREMARALQSEMETQGLVCNHRDMDSEPATLQQAQNLMAKAMGYAAGWQELLTEVSKPHRPVYLDGLGQDTQSDVLSALALNLSRLIGIDYAHGHVYRALEIAGVGCSPAARRALAAQSSPWGLVENREVLAPGIEKVETGSHGGYILSAERQSRMPAHLRLDEPFYEEDCDWALVVVAFPAEFSKALRNALVALDVFGGHAAGDMDADEAREVVDYLAGCVMANRQPVVRVADSVSNPSLQDWCTALRSALRINGAWPTRRQPWHEHWSAWARREKAMADMEMALHGQFTDRGTDKEE